LGRRRLELGAFQDGNGTLRLVVPFPAWADLLLISLDEILFYGADSVQLMRRMKALLMNRIAMLPEKRHAGVRRWKKRLKSSIGRPFLERPGEGGCWRPRTISRPLLYLYLRCFQIFR
jgi:hypothetical protein